MSVEARASTGGVEASSRRGALDHGFAWRLLDALRDPAYFVDVRGRTLYWNEAMARFTGYPAEEVLGRPASNSKLGYEDAAGVPLRTDDFPGKRTLREGRAVDRMISVRRRDGERIPAEARCSPVRDEAGAVAGRWSGPSARPAWRPRATRSPAWPTVAPWTGCWTSACGSRCARAGRPA